jgi:hypothetical protein
LYVQAAFCHHQLTGLDTRWTYFPPRRPHPRKSGIVDAFDLRQATYKPDARAPAQRCKRDDFTQKEAGQGFAALACDSQWSG